MDNMIFTHMSQLYPFIDTTNKSVCKFINGLKTSRLSLTYNKHKNLIIQIKKFGVLGRFVLSITESLKMELYQDKIIQQFKIICPNIKLHLVKYSEQYWVRINTHSIFGIKLPHGVYNSIDCPFIEIPHSKRIIIIIPNIYLP